MTNKRNKQLQNSQSTNYRRRKIAYEIIQIMAARENIPLPNNQNGGHSFDEWLENKLQEMKMTKTKTVKRGMREITRKIWQDSDGWVGYELTEVQDRDDGMMYPTSNGEHHTHFTNEADAKEWLHALS